MYENHQREQYFFDQDTLNQLADFAGSYRNPCCLCTPLLGQELTGRGIETRILDIDERFSHLPGFKAFDIYKPAWLGEEYGLIICDPPFFNVSLSQLFKAIRILSRYDYRQPLLLCYLARRAANVLGTFSHFNLQPSGFYPTYQTVTKIDRNHIEFFSNVGEAFGNAGEAQHQKLRAKLRRQDNFPVANNYLPDS